MCGGKRGVERRDEDEGVRGERGEDAGHLVRRGFVVRESARSARERSELLRRCMAFAHDGARTRNDKDVKMKRERERAEGPRVAERGGLVASRAREHRA